MNSTVIRTGRWTKAEMEYLEAIVQNFRDGKLDIPNGTTLRGYIAAELRCLVKRISKKMEGTSYNGRQRYERKLFDEAELQSKKRELLLLKERFEESIEELRLQEEVPRFSGSKGVRGMAARSDSLFDTDLGFGGANITDLLMGGSSPGTLMNNKLLLLSQRLQTAQRLETLLAARTSQYMNAIDQLTAAAPPSPSALVMAATTVPPPTSDARLLAMLAATNSRSPLNTSALIPGMRQRDLLTLEDMPSSKRRRLS